MISANSRPFEAKDPARRHSSSTGERQPYALSVALFGGTVPYNVTWLNEHGIDQWIWIYCSPGALVSLIVFLTMPETKERRLDQIDHCRTLRICD